MTDKEILDKVDVVLKELDEFAGKIDSDMKKMSRPEYMEKYTEKNTQHFAFSAQEIYDNKIPFKVIGCTGIAKLFSFFARQKGLPQDVFFIVPTVKIDDLINGEHLNGHQIAAVKLSDGQYHLFDPGAGNTFESAEIKTKGQAVITSAIDAQYSGKLEYMITDFMNPDDFDKVDSYQKLENIYKNKQVLRWRSFVRGQTNIDKIVYKSIVNKMPTLDYIMGVDNMSETDKIFYEAYKKYGNRNHTWQDFKEMFNGDVENMQKTVKHWNTWDKINTVACSAHDKITKLTKQIRDLLKKYNLQKIDPDLYKSYKDKYPDLAAAFEERTKIFDSIPQENYSTFDVDISKLETEFESKFQNMSNADKKPDLIMPYIDKMYELVDMRNRDFVMGERIQEYLKIIWNNPDILHMAVKFKDLSGTEKVDLARLILNESAKKFGTPTGMVLQDDAENGPHVLKPGQEGGYVHKRREFLFLPDSFTDLPKFLSILAHEDAHRIDYFTPNMGMLGDQVIKWAEANYFDNVVIGTTEYRKQPSEQSSYYLQDTIGSALDYVVRHSANKE